jgi:hypothetical protein
MTTTRERILSIIQSGNFTIENFRELKSLVKEEPGLKRYLEAFLAAMPEDTELWRQITLESRRGSQSPNRGERTESPSRAESLSMLKAIIETVYTDGIDEVLSAEHDEGRGLIWGKFRDGAKTFPFEINLESGEITY